MKHLFFLTLLSFTIFACSSDNDIEDQGKFQENVQIWELVKMTENEVNGNSLTGNNMMWQEFYQLNADNTFSKSRDTNGRKVKISGSYQFISLEGETYLELTYTNDDEIIGNCTATNTELLLLQSKTELIGTWWACDGPGLFYERKQ